MKRIILLVAALMATTVVMHAKLKKEYSKQSSTGASSPVFGVTASPDIPMSVMFAGEKVSFDRLDMAERLDREVRRRRQECIRVSPEWHADDFPLIGMLLQKWQKE